MRLSYGLFVLALCLAFASCGENRLDRTASGAAVGAGTGAAAGLLLGPLGAGAGALIGAGAGAGVGAVTDKDDINLGDPVWD